MNKTTFSITLAAIAIILAITNPTVDAHKAKVKEVFYSKLDIQGRATAGENDYEKAGAALGSALGLQLVDKMLDAMISRDSYVLFSTTKVTHKGSSNIIGVGFLGNVFITKDFDPNISDDTL